MQLTLSQKFKRMNYRRKKKFLQVMFYRVIIEVISGTTDDLKKMRRGSKKRFVSVGTVDIKGSTISFKGAF